MSNQLKFGTLIGIILLLLGLLIYAEQRVYNAVTDANRYKLSLSDENLATKSQAGLLREKESEIYELKLQNKHLRDSIEVLREEVGRLNSVLGQQGRQILENNAKMKEMQMREDSLVKEIGRMLGLESNNKTAINRLEKERLTIGQNKAALYKENELLKDSIVNVTVNKEELKEKLTLQQQIYEISNNTVVKFKGVYPKRDNGNRARNAKQWITTEIDLELFHPKGGILENDSFMIVIMDLDKKILIAPREANAGKDTQGVLFSFTGNPVKTIRYPNYQNKNSEKYGVQVFYIKNGKQYALNNGGMEYISFKK